MKKILKVSTLLLLTHTLCAYANHDVDYLKKNILSIAEQARGSADEDGHIRASLDSNIQQLLALSPTHSIEEKLKKLQGAWDQVWGPYTFSNLDGFKLDPNNMYQVIMPDGYYYNIGFATFNGQKTSDFVRGEYKIVNDRLQVQFTQNQFLVDYLPTQSDLKTIAQLKEVNFLKTQDIPGGYSQTPAYLHDVYVDNDLRITYGGRNDNDNNNQLYILEKIKRVK